MRGIPVPTRAEVEADMAAAAAWEAEERYVQGLLLKLRYRQVFEGGGNLPDELSLQAADEIERLRTALLTINSVLFKPPTLKMSDRVKAVFVEINHVTWTALSPKRSLDAGVKLP